jgi:hypothetical protein
LQIGYINFVTLISRPTIKSCTFAEFITILTKYPQNSDAKYSAVIDDGVLDDWKMLIGNSLVWVALDDTLVTTNRVLVFKRYSFYSDVIINDVERLTDTGIMSYLIKNHRKSYTQFLQTESEPTVLNIEDLAFGFNIWLGFCGTSLAAFLAEMLLDTKLCRKYSKFLKSLKFRKMKFAKVHQSVEKKCQYCYKNQKLSQELIEKFKVKKIKTENDVETKNSTEEPPELTESSSNSHLNAEHSKIKELEHALFGELISDGPESSICSLSM